MEPKPVITYFGDVEILGTVLQKKLQSKLVQLQGQSVARDEGSVAFSALCNGVEFLHFVSAQEKAKQDLPFYQRPALHTFWSGCSDADRYRSHDRPLIKQWLDNITKMGCGDHAPAMTLVIYCITAEVRAKRQRPLAHLGSSSIEERLRTDYKASVDDLIIFRLASSEESRLVESFNSVVLKLNQMMLTQFDKDIRVEQEAIARVRDTRSDPEHFYCDLFLRKLHLAVTYEMTLHNEDALSLYSEATTDLEDALTMFADSASPPKWLEDIRNAPCTTWDYPKLAWTQLSWQYLAGIRTCSSPLLHTRTFLLVRVAHLLFVLERAWSVSQLVISTLHCMAREIIMLKLKFPAGAFDCWAYMTCNEAILAFMARISPDSLESATSSLLLVRAELWHYALQKLHDIGVLCGLMPSSNKLNYDGVLIKHISSGITPVPAEYVDTNMIGVEDQGKKLQAMLNDRQAFQTEFLVLGEMVIGAFKHAGRRRMAFRVGTMMAQFHRDLGLVVEAEELLSDICKFYSEDQWTELSTKAYSLLADCQLKLRLEDKHVTTMLLLASLPPYPAAAHDPLQWMEHISRIAQRSPYQKLLTWEPLLELVKMEVLDKKEAYCTEDTIQVELLIRMHGPKEMKPLIATLHTKLSSSLQGSSSGSHTPHKAPPHGHSPNLSISSIPTLEELDLELNISHLPHSRPIGGSSKHRSANQGVTHISHAALAEMELGWQEQGEEGAKGRELLLSAMRVTLEPGDNRVVLQGKPSRIGEFAPHKISLKFGSLDFAYTVPPEKAKQNIFSVQDPQVNVDIALTPAEGVFLAGCEQHCLLSFTTSCGTAIPDSASVRVVVPSDVNMQIQLPVATATVSTNEEAGTIEHSFTLPAVPSDTSHECHVTLKLPASWCVRKSIADSAQDQQEQLPAWQYEVDVYCDWLSPCYVATLPLTVYEPLSLSCLEHSAGGDTTFLQLLLHNTCPLPLLLQSPTLCTSLGLEKLQGPLPQVFFPLESHSFLWKAQSDCPAAQEQFESSFSVQFSCLPLTFDWDQDDLPSDPTLLSAHFNFMLSNMQTVFEVDGSVQPVRDQVWVVAQRPALLVYEVRNITKQSLPETQFGTTPLSAETTPTTKERKLGYELCLDKGVWSLQEPTQERGVLATPTVQSVTTLQVAVVPNSSGSVPVPRLQLKWAGPNGEGQVLTDAQVYETSRGQTVTVHTSSSAGR